MGKRNKNRETGRPATGGIRKTANYRSVSRPESRHVSDGLFDGFFKPDLSAFETVNEVANARISYIDTPAARAAARGVSSSTHSPRANTASPSKRSLERKNEPLHPGRARVTPYTPITNKPTPKPAMKLERHEVRPARLEPQRATCKPRPKDNRAKSGGSGKEFVPWCDRR